MTETDAVQRWRKEFEASRYGIVRQALAIDAAYVATQYMHIQKAYYPEQLLFDEEQQSFGRYNDPLGESVLAVVWPKLKELSGLELLPTYSFTRMYVQGGNLAKHVDRPSCEVSATLFLGSDASWPICVDVDGEDREIHLGPGDLMLYRGCEVPHWRNRFDGQYSVHMFLHFVEAGGPHEHLLYDQRVGLGAPQTLSAPVRDEDNMPQRVRRNDPCPCGSGKRFKNCHGER